MFNEICLLMMFLHLYIFGEGGIVNGTDNLISTEGRITFIQNIGLLFDSFDYIIKKRAYFGYHNKKGLFLIAVSNP